MSREVVLMGLGAMSTKRTLVDEFGSKKKIKLSEKSKSLENLMTWRPTSSKK